MTCIVGLRTADGQIYIGGDSAVLTHTGTTLLVAAGKVFYVGSDYLVATAGARRVSEIMRHCFEPPQPQGNLAETIDRFMAMEFANALRVAFRSAGALKTSEDIEKFDGCAIVGVRGRGLYYLPEDFSATRLSDDVMAAGTGSDFALAVLDATVGLEPEKRVKLALEVAAKRNEAVRPPFHVLKI